LAIYLTQNLNYQFFDIHKQFLSNIKVELGATFIFALIKNIKRWDS